MFRIADPDATYPCRLKVQVPGAEGPVEHECTVHFRLLSGSEADALVLQGDVAMAREVLVGWSDIQDADGEPLAYSEAARDRLADIPYFARAVAFAYMRWVAGVAPGNSAAPPAAS